MQTQFQEDVESEFGELIERHGFRVLARSGSDLVAVVED